MSKKKRFLYIICTFLLSLLLGYVVFTGCHLPELPEAPVQEAAALSPGGDLC